MPRSWKEAIILLLLLALAALGGAWLTKPITPTQGINTTALAPAAPALKKTPKIDMAIKKPVKVYAGGAKTKRKLKLPAKVVNNKQQQVIAGIKLSPRDDYPRSITTVLDASTGESETYVTKEPLPWLAIDTRGSVGAYIGIKNGEQTARLQAKQNLIQIKRLHLGVIGSIDQPLNNASKQDYFIGIGGELTW